MLKTKKNYFDFNNNYDKLRDAQDADKMTTLYKDVMMHDIPNEIKPDITKPSNGMLSPMGDTTYDTNGIPTTNKTPTLDTDFKWVGDGATAKFEDKLAERNKLNNDKWGNYGTGTLFGNDWKFNDNAGDIVRNEYEQAKSLNTNFEQQYQQTLQRYKDVAAENDRASQKAYIQKQQNLRNANTQARAMGRGGLGITESGYRRTDNNYNNQVTELDNQANRNLNMTLNDYLNYANGADNSARLNEENAKAKYGDYLIENIGNYLNGDKNGESLGMLEDKLTKDDGKKTYTVDGVTKKVGNYYDTNTENELLNYLNGAFDTKDGKDNYFLDGKSHNEIQQRYKDAITAMGSGNTGYKQHLTEVDAAQKAQDKIDLDFATANKPAVDRGSLGNINTLQTTTEKTIGGGETTATMPNGHKISISNNTKYDDMYFESRDGKKIANALNARAPKAAGGDILFDEGTRRYYVCVEQSIPETSYGYPTGKVTVVKNWKPASKIIEVEK